MCGRSGSHSFWSGGEEKKKNSSRFWRAVPDKLITKVCIMIRFDNAMSPITLKITYLSRKSVGVLTHTSLDQSEKKTQIVFEELCGSNQLKKNHEKKTN